MGMITVSQPFSPQPFTLSYVIANASNMIVTLFFCLFLATIFSTIVVLLLLRLCEIISDILLETLEDDTEDGRTPLVVQSFLTNQDSLNQISHSRERLQSHSQTFGMRSIHKASSMKLPQLVIYGQNPNELSPFCSSCVICLESFITGESCQILPPCNHLFHSYCIRHWLKDNASCPICRSVY
ncbi:hypothetical protein ACSQ67_010207 [Phaseolus vulgaris]